MTIAKEEEHGDGNYEEMGIMFSSGKRLGICGEYEYLGIQTLVHWLAILRQHLLS